jgi:hypothetical protein
MAISRGLVLLLLVASISSLYLLDQIYPTCRVLTWFEVVTDGMAPDWVAQDATLVTGQVWVEFFSRGYIDQSGASEALVQLIESSSSSSTRNAKTSPSGDTATTTTTTTSTTTDDTEESAEEKDDDNNMFQADVLELAAGSGVAAVLWQQLFQSRGLSKVRTVLTDLQPKLDSWNKIVQDPDHYNNMQYISHSVDVTDARNAVEAYDAQHNIVSSSSSSSSLKIRMIHFALHHLEPNVVQGLFQDAIDSNAVIFVGDLTPTLGDVIFHNLLALDVFLRVVPQIGIQQPHKLLLVPFVPIMLLAMFHDATVSALRAYSLQELKQLLLAAGTTTSSNASTTNNHQRRPYHIQTFQSVSFAEYFGIPAFVPMLRDPVLQFFLAVPVTNEACGKIVATSSECCVVITNGGDPSSSLSKEQPALSLVRKDHQDGTTTTTNKQQQQQQSPSLVIVLLALAFGAYYTYSLILA